MNEYITTNSKMTRVIGREVALKLAGGDIVLLYGELGAGKTTLVKGIAKGLGVRDDIVSPTFTLMNVYLVHSSEFRVQRLVHVDTYRLKDEQELRDIGIEDYLGRPDTVCVIEWPEKIQRLLERKKLINISISHQNGDGRKIAMGDGKWDHI